MRLARGSAAERLLCTPDDSSSILEPMVDKNRLPRAVSSDFHTCVHTYTQTFFFFKERDERKETLLLVFNIS